MFIVSLTSIPPRFSRLPEFFACMGRQSVKPDAVMLTIPASYSRFPGQRPALPPLPEWVTLVETPIDLGPATKVLPVMQSWRGTAADILYCDDDRRYDANWIRRFKASRHRHPSKVICERGVNVEYFGQTRTTPKPLSHARFFNEHRSHRLVKRLTFNLYRRFMPSITHEGTVDIAEGFGGVLARPGMLDPRAFDVPQNQRLTDDIWLSAMFATQGTDIWLHKHARISTNSGEADSEAGLRDLVTAEGDAIERHGKAIRHAQQHYGIW